MRKRNYKSTRSDILIMTAGEDEALFFSQMRRDCRYSNLTVRNIDDSIDSLEKMIKLTARMKKDEDFDQAWCLFNPDDLEISPYDVYECTKIAESKKISLAHSNPGIELWYYLHFAIPQMPFVTREKAAQALRTFVPDYRIGSRYLKEVNKELYLTLFPQKAQAFINANKYNMRFGDTVQAGNIKLDYACTIPKMLQEITDVCGKCFITRGQGFASHHAIN